MRLLWLVSSPDPIVTSAFQDLLQISPDIFQEFDLDNLVSEKPVLAKEKDVSKKKISPKLIQSGLGVVGTKKEEEILATRISTRGRIIRNTRKIFWVITKSHTSSC